MEDTVHSTFVSQKISKIRWKPEQLNESQYFVTGGTDEINNYLTLWNYPVKQTDSENYPLKERTFSHLGDVTDMKFLLNNHLVVSSSCGFVTLLQCDQSDFRLITTWERLHYYKTKEPSPCTGLACFEEDIATIGEDGRIVLLTLVQTKPIRVIESLNSSSHLCIDFLKHNELLTGDLRGQMKIWDLRVPENCPLTTFMLSGDQIAAMCIAVHSSQKHILLVGGEDGSVYVWDLRKSTHPINIINAHKGSVSEMVFHPLHPEHLFTCSSSGQLWHWNTVKNIREYDKQENIWLSSNTNNKKMEIFSLMPTVHKPINSLDVNRNRLICGCDNEAIYIIKNLPI